MIEKIKDQLERTQTSARYQHSLNVANECVKLGERYSCDLNECYLAGLLHDIGKVKNKNTLKSICESAGININDDSIEDFISEPNGHAIIGSLIAEKMFGVNDNNILNAIKYHTTGKANMSMIEKIVYLADYIEVGRKFEGVERARELAYKDIDQAMLYVLDSTIVHLIELKKFIIDDTVRARNYFVKNRTGGI